MVSSAAATACLMSLLSISEALDNGLALRPPMGWRNWNAYAGDIDDSVMRMAIGKMASRQRLVDGTPTSLADLGYARMGIDDNWQACGTGYKGSFHAQDGTPLVNASRFPDLKGLVDYGHDKGLKMGWYNINCICLDSYIVQRDSDKDWSKRVYAAEVQLMRDAGFDGVKVDNCGDDQGIGFEMMNDIINKSGNPMLIENCNQGHSGNPRGVPTDPTQECPGNFFRTGGDIRNDFGIVMDKLQRTTPYQDLDAPISRPDCWAYPDMLEVGNFAGDYKEVQHRTHFGAWCVVSSPLYLSFDLADDKITDAIWPIISNQEAIAVNQAWAGHPGRLVKDGGDFQVWAKKMEDGGQAVLVLNRGGHTIDSHALPLADFDLYGTVSARDIWQHEALSSASGTWDTGVLAAYDSVFVRFGPGGPKPPTPPTPPPPPTPSVSCEEQCVAEGHCCVGQISSWQHPSCAMGCTVAMHTGSLSECQQTCKDNDATCSWSIASVEMNNCASCPSGCDASSGVGECLSGCKHAFALSSSNLLV